MIRNSLSLFFGLVLAVCAFAQPMKDGSGNPKPSEFEYPTVAAALAAVSARWDVERFYRGDGWLGFSDSKNKTIWAFAPNGHPAYPAVVKRVMIDDGKVVTVKTTSRCEGLKASCDEMLQEFKALDGNADEYLKFQGRNSSANILNGAPPPPQPAGK
jgi:hypothetical protein